MPNIRRNLSDIGREILLKWRTPTNYAAKPYAQAMLSLNTVNDNYGHDSGREIVLRFLCNAQMWRGEIARNIKAELKAHLKDGEGRV